MSSDDEILIDLGRTLDLSLVDKLSKSNRKILKNTVLNRNITEFKHKSLETLLKHKYLKLGNWQYPQYILGPMRLTKLQSLSKTIYIFGELHIPFDQNVSKCQGRSMRITQFLEFVFNSTYVPIDYFMETSLYDATAEQIYQPGTNYLDVYNLRALVQRCVIADKKDCDFPAVRSHYVDVRDLPEYPTFASIEGIQKDEVGTPKVAIKLCDNIAKDLKTMIPLFQSNKIISKINKQLQNAEDKYKNTVTKLVLQRVKDYTDLLDSIPSIQSVENIYKNYEILQTKIQNLYGINIGSPSRKSSFASDLEQMYTNISNFYLRDEKKEGGGRKEGIKEEGRRRKKGRKEKTRHEKITKHASDIGEVLYSFCHSVFWLFAIIIGTPLMDAFTLARMFRTFKQVEYYNSTPPNNIIYYAGNAHAENMIEMIKQVDDFKITEFKSGLASNPVNMYDYDYPYCIDLNGMKELFPLDEQIETAKKPKSEKTKSEKTKKTKTRYSYNL